MAKEKVIIQVPFNKNGQVTSTDHWQNVIQFKDNYIFSGTLRYKGWHSGRSSAVITWIDINGKEYQSGMQMLNDVLLRNNIDYIHSAGFAIISTFTFKKQGTAVLLTLT